MVNPDLDGYTKILNHRKTIRETQKKTTYWNQRIL